MQLRLILFLLIIALILLPAVTLMALRKIKIENNTITDKQVNIYKDDTFKESFTASENNLNSVLIKMKNPGVNNHEPVFFTLTDNNNLYREVPINGYNITDSDWVRFSFERIPDSKNKVYYFSLSSPLSSNNNAISVAVSNNDKAGLITYYAVDSHLALILNTYSQFLNKLTQDQFFLFVWSVCLFLSIFMYFGAKKHDQPD